MNSEDNIKVYGVGINENKYVLPSQIQVKTIKEKITNYDYFSLDIYSLLSSKILKILYPELNILDFNYNHTNYIGFLNGASSFLMSIVAAEVFLHKEKLFQFQKLNIFGTGAVEHSFINKIFSENKEYINTINQGYIINSNNINDSNIFNKIFCINNLGGMRFSLDQQILKNSKIECIGGLNKKLMQIIAYMGDFDDVDNIVFLPKDHEPDIKKFIIDLKEMHANSVFDYFLFKSKKVLDRDCLSMIEILENNVVFIENCAEVKHSVLNLEHYIKKNKNKNIKKIELDYDMGKEGNNENIKLYEYLKSYTELKEETDTKLTCLYNLNNQFL